MTATTKETACNFDLLRKCVRLLDSDRPGEREAAFRQALKQCTQSGILFWEAVVQAFREEDDSRMEDAVCELQARLEQRESEAALLAEKYMEAEARIQQLTGAHEENKPAYSFRRLVRHSWSLPQTRLLALALVIACRLLFFWYWGDSDSAATFWMVSVPMGGFALHIFCKWTCLQFRAAGLLQLLVKWSVFAVGLVLSFACFFGEWSWVFGFDISAWSGYPVLSHGLGLFILAVAAVLTVSRFSDWFIDAVCMRLWESRKMQVIRGCF